MLMATMGYGMMQNYVHTNTRARFAESLKNYGRYQACSGGGCDYPDNKDSGYDAKCYTGGVKVSGAAMIVPIVVVASLVCLGCCAGIGVGIYFCVRNKKGSQYSSSTGGARATTMVAAPEVATANAGAYAPPAPGVATANAGAYAPPTMANPNATAPTAVATAYPMQNMVVQPVPAMAGQPYPVAVQAPAMAGQPAQVYAPTMPGQQAPVVVQAPAVAVAVTNVVAAPPQQQMDL